MTYSKTIILGRLGADPAISLTGNGKEIARLSIATTERYTDSDGNKQERTEWHRAVIFSQALVSKVVKPYLNKGSQVLIEGSNRTESYTEKDGVQRYSTEIVVSELNLVGGNNSKKSK